MALPARAGERRSFVDARNDGRQMEVTWHEDACVLVISLWQGNTCRSTFRMPIEDAPALIGIVASALESVVATRGPDRPGNRVGPAGDTVRLRALPSPEPQPPGR